MPGGGGTAVIGGRGPETCGGGPLLFSPAFFTTMLRLSSLYLQALKAQSTG